MSACLHALGDSAYRSSISRLFFLSSGSVLTMRYFLIGGMEQKWNAIAPSMALVCSTTTILVFGILMTSHVPILRAIGLTAGLGSLCCMLFGAILAERTSLGSSIR